MIVKQIAARPYFHNLQMAAAGLGDGWQKERIRKCYVLVMNESIKRECELQADINAIEEARITLRDLAKKRLSKDRVECIKEAANCLMVLD
jgi:hypothetical protein